MNNRNTYQTSQVLLDWVINVLDRNTQSEEELINSLKDDYIVRAKAVAYIIDAKPEAERKIANLMSVDEVHLFDKDGTIYSGSVPKYYGYNFDSGEQIEYFKPMLTDKTLTMCQDVTPNTSEGKEMMYAITWNEAGTRMVQVGIKPVRLLEEVKQNEVSSVVENMPVYEGMSILVADTKTGEIYGATDTDKIGKTLEDIGVDTRNFNLAETASVKVSVDGKKQKCILRQDDKYVVGVLIASTFNFKNTIIAMLIVGVYLSLATACMIYMLWRIFKTDKNLTPKFLDYLYFEPINTGDANLIQEMKKNLLVSFLANEQAKIYIRQTDNSEQFVQALIERGAKPDQIILLSLDAKGIFQKIIEQMRQDFPNQTTFSITENRVSLITPSSEIKPRLALANMMFARQFKGVEVDDFSYLDQARENLQHNNYAIRYKTFQAMLEGLN